MIHGKATARVHPVHLMDMERHQADVSRVGQLDRTVGCFFTEHRPCIMRVNIDKESSSSQTTSNFHLIDVMMPLDVTPLTDLHGTYTENVNILQNNRHAHNRNSI